MDQDSQGCEQFDFSPEINIEGTFSNFSRKEIDPIRSKKLRNSICVNSKHQTQIRVVPFFVQKIFYLLGNRSEMQKFAAKSCGTQFA
jgi:hypothetical protein